MITLTINIPDNGKDVISDIASIVTTAGGDMAISSDDEDLSSAEFQALQKAYKEALLIKDGKLKGIPVSELWND